MVYLIFGLYKRGKNMADQASFTMVCNGCVEIAVAVAAGSPTVTVVDTNGTLGTVTAGNSQTFNDYLVNGNTATVSIPDGNTVASGKITGTIKYTNCPTPTPTSTAPPSPTPSPTPGGGGTVLSGGATCAGRVSWPAYGSGNQYIVTWNAASTPQFFQSDNTTRTFYINNGSTILTRKGYNGSCFQMASNNITSGQGLVGFATNPTFFSLEIPSGPSFPVSMNCWIE
jgi:hypothetical protein